MIKRKVLRYNKVLENENNDEHYRKLVMLFTSWRNEEYDLLKECSSYYETYQKMEPIILHNQQKYEKIYQQVLEEASTDFSEDIESSYRESGLPQNDHEELIDSAEGHQPSNTYGCFDQNKSQQMTFPCLLSNPVHITLVKTLVLKLDDSCLALNEMNDEEYIILAQNLNFMYKKKNFSFIFIIG